MSTPAPVPPVPSEPFGVLLISGTYERAHYAMVVATAAAALGRAVVFFATNQGCNALGTDWSNLADAESDHAVEAAGVAGFDTLREAAHELGIRMIACEAGLRIAALDSRLLAPGVEVAGIVTFLAATRGGQIVTF